MMDLRGFKHVRAIFTRGLFASSMLILTMMGCSKADDIQLQGYAKPAPSQPASPVNSPTDSSVPPKGESGETPISSPLPVEPRYRMFCSSRYSPYIKTISSLASATGAGASLEIGEPDANGKFDPIKEQNLEYQQQPLVVNLPKFGEARLLFGARKLSSGATPYPLPRKIYVGDVAVVNRGGIAREIGPEFLVSAANENVAAFESLLLRTYGVSDQGRYLLIGQSDGYKILDSKTLQSLGVVKTGSASENFNPSLRESDMIFSTSSIQGKSFASKLYSLGWRRASAGGPAKLESSKLISSTGSLRRPLVAVGSRAGESFAALDQDARIAVVSPLGTKAQRVKLAGVPAKGRVASSLAFWRDEISNELRAVWVFEHFVPTGSLFGALGDRYKIEQVFVRVVRVDEATLTASAIEADYDYPPEARSTVQIGIGGSMIPGVSELRASPDGKAIFGLFPGGLAGQVYRLTTAGLQRVSHYECSGLSIGVEP